MEGITKKIKVIGSALVALCTLILALFGIKKEFTPKVVEVKEAELDDDSDDTDDDTDEE